MEIYALNPLHDNRWRELIHRHPKACVFQTPAWLSALRQTYGYEPIVYTTSPPDAPLANGLVGCIVRSWITGTRLVSVPFSDHCEPLFESLDESVSLVQYLQGAVEKEHWKYVEIRPVDGFFREIANSEHFQATGRYFLHCLDLRRDKQDLFRSLDKDSIQRRIQRATRAGLVEESGRSEQLLKDFYALLVITRKRHQLPPQPFRWFQNLVASFGSDLDIKMAYKDGTPVASILTLGFKDTVYYKYGCSDSRFNKLGATPLLLWRAIESAKCSGACRFDFGRSEMDNPGLIAFKDKWAPRLDPVVYFRYPKSHSQTGEGKMKFMKRIFAHMPERLLTAVGTVIYPHIA
jgi:CelD/BcsL family acetyltransferase involved in cellulose biosynthesis